MTLSKIRLGTNDDGSPQYHWTQDDPTKAVVFTGPITGPVTLADGTTIDVTDAFVEVDSPAQAAELSDAIGARYVDEGHPSDVGFEHVPTLTEG